MRSANDMYFNICVRVKNWIQKLLKTKENTEKIANF